MRINSLLLITGNSGKAEEFRKLISINDLEFRYMSLDIPEIQSMSLEEIGRAKTRTALTYVEQISQYDAVLTDDTGLFCEGMNGLPGPFIKWFLDSLGVDGLWQMVQRTSLKTRAVCLLSLGLLQTGQIFQFKGEVVGSMNKPKGEQGFGWDRSFKPEGYDVTYGEMDRELKNRISHRTLAVNQMRDWIVENRTGTV